MGEATLAGTQFLLITTADEREIRDGDIFSLLDSLDVGMGVIAVLRAVIPGTAERVTDHPRVLSTVHIPAAGISRARNAGLAWLRDQVEVRSDAYVAFPDDDCQYTPELGERLTAGFERTGADILVGRYGPSPSTLDRDRFPDIGEQIHGWKSIHRISSAGLFLRWRTTRHLSFNEALGVGASLPAAEEIDYSLRALNAGLTVVYDPDLVVLHPYRKASGSLPRWEAWLALTTGHALAHPSSARVAVRAWGGWVFRLLTGAVGPRHAMRVARAALAPRPLWRIRHMVRDSRRRSQ